MTAPISDERLDSMLRFYRGDDAGMPTPCTVNWKEVEAALTELQSLRSSARRGEAVAKADAALVNDIIHVMDRAPAYSYHARTYTVTPGNTLYEACRAARAASNEHSAGCSVASQSQGSPSGSETTETGSAQPSPPQPCADAALTDRERLEAAGFEVKDSYHAMSDGVREYTVRRRAAAGPDGEGDLVHHEQIRVWAESANTGDLMHDRVASMAREILAYRSGRLP